MTLQAGHTIRMSGTLWRVDYVNASRAHITPLTGGRATSISPNSEVEIVTDLERAQDEIALKQVERELAELRLVAQEPMNVLGRVDDAYHMACTGEALGWVVYLSERTFARVHRILLHPEDGPVIVIAGEALEVDPERHSVYATEGLARAACCW